MPCLHNSFLACFSNTVIKYHLKATLGRKGFIQLVGYSSSLWEVGAGVQAEVVEEHCLLACSSCFLYTTGPPAQRCHYPEWDRPSTSIISQGNVSLMCPQVNPIEAVPQWRVPLPR